MDPAELEQFIDRKLRRLPAPRAPETLLPRVLRAVDVTAGLAGPARTWFTWPRAWQALSIGAVVLIVAGAAMLWPTVQAALSGALSEPAVAVTTRVVGIVKEADGIARALRIVWRVLVQPIAIYAIALVVVMCAACAAFGTALGRVALGGSPR